MKKLILAAALAAAAVGINGCAQQGTKASPATATSGAEAEYERALAEAEAARKEAAAVGGEWRDTGKLIKQAEQAAAKGDFEQATQLAERAAFQGRMGKQQAAEQAKVGNPSYLY